MTVTKPEQVDIATRLQLAEAEVGPLRTRVAELEAALNEAVDARDYDKAKELQAALVPARQEFGIAQATAAALAAAVQEIEGARQAEQRKIAEQRRREDMEAQLEQVQTAEAEHMDAMRTLIARARAGVEAVRENLQQALNHQGAAGMARREAHNLLATLNGQQPSQYVTTPADVSALLEGADPVLRVVYHGRV